MLRMQTVYQVWVYVITHCCPKHETKMQLVNIILLLSISHGCLSGVNKLEANPDNGWQ